MPFESIESLTSFLFDDVEPIITTQEEREKYDEIYLDFQRCLEPEPITSFGEANTSTILYGAVPEEAEPMATTGEPNTSIENMGGENVEQQPRVEDEPDIPASPSEAITTPPTKTRPSRKGRKKKMEESQRPDWLPEGWTSSVEVRRNGASAGAKDRYYFAPGSGRRFRSKKEVEKFIKAEALRLAGDMAVGHPQDLNALPSQVHREEEKRRILYQI